MLALWATLAFEAAGGLVLFATELVSGRRPGETAHVLGGALLAALYAAYQWGHWRRVSPIRARPDTVLGLLAAGSMALTLLTGFALGPAWWRDRIARPTSAEVAYSSSLAGLHNIGSMLVLAFVGAHLAAVLLRDRPRS